MALSMILADSVHQDRTTGKAFILGTFQNVAAKTYPTRHPEMAVFAELTGGRGSTPVTLKFCRTTADELEGELLSSFKVDLEFPDPRHVVNLIVNINGVEFPQEGEYRVIIEVDGAFVCERRILALRPAQ